MEDIIIIKEKEQSIEPSVRTPHFELEDIKNKIESMDKLHHIEILKILKKSAAIKLNENKSGIFVNLSFLSTNTLDEIKKYINYINVQETSISHLETQCDNFKNTFFVDKEDKDNIVLYNSLVK
jgi:cupin superfamily acireductone dioxygenase involved in methionine salvage